MGEGAKSDHEEWQGGGHRALGGSRALTDVLSHRAAGVREVIYFRVGES